MPLKDETEVKLFDVRTVKNYVRRGKTERKEYERFLKSLPDAADKAEPVESGQHPGRGPGGRKGSVR